MSENGHYVIYAPTEWAFGQAGPTFPRGETRPFRYLQPGLEFGVIDSVMPLIGPAKLCAGPKAGGSMRGDDWDLGLALR